MCYLVGKICRPCPAHGLFHQAFVAVPDVYEGASTAGESLKRAKKFGLPHRADDKSSTASRELPSDTVPRPSILFVATKNIFLKDVLDVLIRTSLSAG